MLVKTTIVELWSNKSNCFAQRIVYPYAYGIARQATSSRCSRANVTWPTREPAAILSHTQELGWIPLSCGMVGCWQINSILDNIGRKNYNRILNQYLFYEIY